nr:immunoglobulin light chain junction region [Macaca mulatta]MOY08439.1 immunoglobulin light chain junction region [Macaca mulatta]
DYYCNSYAGSITDLF